MSQTDGDDPHRRREHEVEEGQNLLQAVLDLGFDLPYFCWHPALGSVGACRQCAVKQFRDENDTRRHDRHGLHDAGQRRACGSPSTIPRRPQFRASVIEWLMTNHPHDCPVCDEGGECHLQDMTVMTGHNHRALPLQQADLPEPGSRPVHQPRDEPLHPVLPLRAVLPGLRRRQGPQRLRLAQPDVLRPGRGRDAGEPVQRQPGRDLPDRRLHRQDR